MPQYRFFLIGEDGRPFRGTACGFHDDETAIEWVKRAAKGQPAELWSGDRLLWREPPEPD